VLYECLTGRQPFGGDSLEQQIGGHLTAPPPLPSERHADIPVQLDAVIAKGMAKNPDDRYSTTRELAQAARAALTAPMTRPEPVPPPFSAPRHNLYPYQQSADVTNHPAPPPSGPSPTDATQYRPAPYGTPPPAPIGPPPGVPPPTDATQYRAMPYGPTGQNPPGPNPPPPLSGPSFADATQYRSMPYGLTGPPPPGPKPSRKGRLIALSSLGALAVVVAVVAVIALTDSGDDGASTHAKITSAAPSELPNTGPFTGTFTAAMGSMTLSDGSPAKGDAAPYSATWRLRSACGANGCVATAAGGSRYPAKDAVFDNVGGGWLAVTNSRTKCGFREDDEAWNVIWLQPQPDGSMSGEYTETTVNGCFTRRTAAFSRTGDTDISALPDPAKLTTRVISPAEALRGAYDAQTIYANGAKSAVDHFRVRTDCLRAGDRCMSKFADPKTGGGQTFVFANGAWSRNEEFDSTCSSGGNNHVTYTASLPLPQPPPNPIRALSGHGYDDVKAGTGSTCHSQAFDETFTRTGD
jgi:serine/threonine-protein kinase